MATQMVETVSLSYVAPPDLTGDELHPALLSSPGALSSLQLESIAYAQVALVVVAAAALLCLSSLLLCAAPPRVNAARRHDCGILHWRRRRRGQGAADRRHDA